MSNTVTIATIAILCAGPVVVAASIAVTGAATIALARWLAGETPADRAAVNRLKDQRRRERLMIPSQGDVSSRRRSHRVTSASLHLRNSESLEHTAEKLGYRIVKPGSRQSQILLARPSGDRLAIGRNEQGQVTVTASSERSIRELVRCHAADRAVEHLKGKGMSIKTVSLPNGEIRITGREQIQLPDGAAKVTTQVHQDGSLFVDVDNIRSNRCETIVSELAVAVGGDVSNRKPKGSNRLPVSSKRQVKL